MQQPAPTQPSPTPSSFAGLLATLASPPTQAAEDDPLWSTSDLGEDVISLSYERALRAHARYRPADRLVDRDIERGDGLPAPPVSSGVDAGADAAIETGAAGATDAAVAAPSLPADLAPDRDLRSASVTIRLSKAECARLRERATEAELTVSAYLRSCVLEAEALRAEVKQALAELKAGAKPPQQAQTAFREPRQGTSQPGSEAAGSAGGDQAAPAGKKKPGWRRFFGWIVPITGRG
jgi:hypothetical protein